MATPDLIIGVIGSSGRVSVCGLQMGGVEGATMSRAIFVLTSTSQMGSTGKATGWYLPEAAHPWEVLGQAGWAIDFVSPAGGYAPMTGVDSSDPTQSAFLEIFGAKGPETR